MKTKTYTIAQDSIRDVLSTLIDSERLGNCEELQTHRRLTNIAS